VTGMRNLLVVSVLLGAASLGAFQSSPDSERAKTPEWFEEKIRPLLKAKCYECHTDEKAGGVRLDSREDMIVGGESGSAIEPGNPEESLLIKMVRHTPKYIPMPKKAPRLKPEEVEALVEWIRAGAPWPSAGPSPTPTPTP
jgi:mono/diheme cytochrome c family protein